MKQITLRSRLGFPHRFAPLRTASHCSHHFAGSVTQATQVAQGAQGGSGASGASGTNTFETFVVFFLSPPPTLTNYNSKKSGEKKKRRIFRYQRHGVVPGVCHSMPGPSVPGRVRGPACVVKGLARHFPWGVTQRSTRKELPKKKRRAHPFPFAGRKL